MIAPNSVKKRKDFFDPIIVSGIFLVLIFILSMMTQLEQRLFINTFFFCVVSTHCIFVIRKLPRRGNDFLDPGLLYVIFAVMSIAPVAVTTVLGVPIRDFESNSLNPLLPKLVLLHLIIIVSFTFSYYLINFRNRINLMDKNYNIWLSNTWLVVFIALVFFFFTVKGLVGILVTRKVGDSATMSLLFHQKLGILGQQIFIHFGNIKGYALLFAVGVFISRAPTLKISYIRLIIVTIVLGGMSFYFFGSRGFGLGILISAACYADIVRWKGNFLSWKVLLLLLLVGSIFLQVFNMLESIFISGNVPGIYDFLKIFVLDYSIVENSAYVVHWVDNNIVLLQYGENYLVALKALLPTQIRGGITFLPQWFISKISADHGVDYAALGIGRAFSTVAEGYLNGKYLGVFIQGIVLAMLASLIRLFKYSKRLGILRPFLFSGTIGVSYVLFRADTVGALTRIKNYSLDIIFVIIIGMIIEAAIRKRKYNQPTQLNNKSI